MKIKTYYNPKSITIIICKAANLALKEFKSGTHTMIPINSARRKYLAQWYQIMDGLYIDQIMLIIRDADMDAENIVSISVVTIDKEV